MKVQNINMCIKHFLRIFCESFENQVREMLGVFEEKASKCFFFFFLTKTLFTKVDVREDNSQDYSKDKDYNLVKNFVSDDWQERQVIHHIF